MKLIGIDPGKKGGIAVLDDDELDVQPMPLLGNGDLDFVRVISILNGANFVFIEKQEMRPGQGYVNGKVMFDYGRFLGSLQALDIAHRVIPAKQWQGVILAGMPQARREKASKDMSKTEAAAFNKRRREQIKANSVTFCQRNYPTISLLASSRCKKPHDGMSDALCILSFLCELQTGQLLANRSAA